MWGRRGESQRFAEHMCKLSQGCAHFVHSSGVRLLNCRFTALSVHSPLFKVDQLTCSSMKAWLKDLYPRWQRSYWWSSEHHEVFNTVQWTILTIYLDKKTLEAVCSSDPMTPHKDCNSSTACCISMGAWMPTKLNVEKQNAWWHEGRGTIINVITAWSCCYFLWMLAVLGLACMRMWWNEWIWRWTACQLSKILKSFDTALLKLLYCVWWPCPRLSPPTSSSSFCCLQSAPLSSPTHDVCVCVCVFHHL